MNQENEIYSLIEQVVEKNNFLLIEVLVRGEKMNRVIEVYIDNEEGITTENCADVSRELNSLFEENNLFSGKYRLDVSSPGVGRPLKYLLQYRKHIGRELEVKYFVNEEKTEKIKGRLSKVEENKLWFTTSDSELVIDFEKVIKSKVLISF
jgi:ribosome maturation factor RimP